MIDLQKNKGIFLGGIFSLAGLALALASYFEKPAALLRFFWGEPFLLSIKIACVAGFCFLIFKWLTRRPLPTPGLKLIGGIIFLPILLLPVFRCYFKVPYIFCRSCPNKCPWGIVRTFVFNSFVLLNFSEKFWCTVLCPFGTFQECQTRIMKKPRLLFPWLAAASSYIFLLLFAGMYVLTLSGARWLEFFEIGRYGWVKVSVVIAALILTAAFFIPKFWCRYFCPVGAIAGLTSSLRSPKPPKEPG